MHISVLLNEAVENLNLKEDSIVVDCTLGYAGHSSEILKKIPKGFLYAFDQDKEVISVATKKLQNIRNNYDIITSNFENIKEELNKRNIYKVNSILFDLGVSSPQLDEDYRGFSFHKDAKLDMRMDINNPNNAYKVVNNYDKNKLKEIFFKYGEEKYSSSIAHKIVEKRKEKNIETTLELVEIIKEAVPEKYKREKHPARKIFQAIRIEVNRELEVFEKALKDSLDLLDIGGRICVITFHSLEDKICKEIFKEVSSIPTELKKMPIIPEELLPKYKIIANIVPSEEEIEINNRARSARLRVIERIK